MKTAVKRKKKTYGNTWWGAQWIEALERIDTNRLARGKTYANTDKVQNIKYHQGDLSARVTGSWRSYYNIEMSLKPFSKDETKKIFDIVRDNPSIALELSMGSLPENLLTLLDKQKINLLPKKWRDIIAHCSCPDYANPCKHLAAVYYMLANEIDKDPFILFRLRGIEREQLQEAAGTLETSQKESFIDKFIDYKDLKPLKKDINIDDFTFSFPKFDINSLFKVLKDNPNFHHEENFKIFLQSIYNSIPQKLEQFWELKEESCFAKNADFYLSEKDFFIVAKNYTEEEVEAVFFKDLRKNPVNFFLIMNENIPPIDIHRKIIIEETEKFKGKRLLGFEVNLKKGLNYFLDLSLDIDTEYASDSFKFLNIAASLAMGLVRANLFIPEVVEKDNGSFSIRYIPYLNNDLVKNQISKLQTIMPQNLCQTGGKVLKTEAAADILSMFMTFIVNKVMSWGNLGEENKLKQCFLLGKTFEAQKYYEKTIGKSIDNWLQPLSIQKSETSPVIRFESEDFEETEIFQVYVDVEQTSYKKLPETKKAEVAKQLVIAGEYMPELKQIVDSKGSKAPIIDLEEMGRILIEVTGLLNILGIEITIPKELKKLAYPHLQFKAKSKGSAEGTYLNLHDLLDFSYEISLGDTTISPAEFKKLLKSTQGLVKYKDRYLLLKPDEVNTILNKLKEPPPELTSPMQALYAAISGEINGIKFEPDKTLKNILSDLTKVEEVELPKALKATLRAYQERGFKWLYSNSKKHLGCCIADDMGLGKTIQIITLLLKYKDEKNLNNPALVICPTTLIGNWQKEGQKFAPSLNVGIYHGVQRQLNTKNKDIILTSYGTLRRDIKKFREKQWSFIIIDEAQNIKNAETNQTKAVKSLKADNYIAMTGTPVENRLTELWNIFDFTNKGYMGNISSFKTNFSVPIEKYKEKDKIEILKKATAPFMIRRLKTDKSIIKDLPDKLIFDEYCYLSKEQAAVYENIVQNTMKTIESSDGIERKGLIFKLIMALKQICNHPANYSKQDKINSELSGKALKAISILETILANREKCLIFTQFREMGDILQKMIVEELQTEALFFHGGVTRKKRDEMVNLFQNDSHKKLMIVSLKAGGTGLNLTAASNVIHYDLWWNPAVENQATDRVYRIGQEKNVIVHRLITLGTFEEKIDEIIKSKKELADLTVSTGEQWITEMSNRDLRDIFTLHKI